MKRAHSIASLRNIGIAVCLAMLLLAPASSFAGQILAFKSKILRFVNPGGFIKCASVSILPPANGFVVVTASGVAVFNNDTSSLYLTLSKAADVRGAWVFAVTPGFQLAQSYSVQFVFPVVGGQNTSFFLNGRAIGAGVDVQTGSITAEFYPSANVQQSAAPAAPSAAAPDAAADTVQEPQPGPGGHSLNRP